MNLPSSRPPFSLIAVLAGLALAAGCASPNSTGISHLEFSGDVTHAIVKIDGRVVPLTDKDRRIEVSPGVHHVHIARDEAVVADRDIYCENNLTMNVPVP